MTVDKVNLSFDNLSGMGSFNQLKNTLVASTQKSHQKA